MSRTLRLPIFPLGGAILFPRSQLPLHIFEPRFMVIGIGRQPLLERGGVHGRRGGDFERGLGAADFRLRGKFGRQAVEDLFGFVSLAGSDERAHQSADDFGIFRRHVADLAENGNGARRIAFGQDLLAHGDQRLDLGLRCRAFRFDLQLGE